MAREPAAAARAVPAAAAPIEGDRQPIRGAAARIAENMERSLEVPTATTQRQIPIKLLDENRRLINEERAAAELSRVSFTHLFSWAIIQALKAFPGLNDAYDGVRRRAGPGAPTGHPFRPGGGRRRRRTARGHSSSPTCRARSRCASPSTSAAADDVVARARSGKLKMSDFEGTTVSLTNPGTLGTTASVPRLLPGQGAIIATGAIEYPAEFSAMAPAMLSRLAISKVVTFTSTYDHRIIQGAESGAFLARVEELLLGKHAFYEEVFAELSVRFPPFRWEVDKSAALFADGYAEEIAKQARVLELINAYRVRGHLLADIDPLRTRQIANHPELDLGTYGLTLWDLDREFWTGGLKGGERMPLRRIIAVMRRVYCGKVGTEYRFISSPTEKYWIRERIAAATAAAPLPAELRKTLLEKLIAAEEFERFLRDPVPGPAPLLAWRDATPRSRCSTGWSSARRAWASTRSRSACRTADGSTSWPTSSATLRERIFSGFEGVVHPDFPADEGDVKYHQGARTVRQSEAGRPIAIQVESNPVAPRGGRPGGGGRRPREAGAHGGPRTRGLEARTPRPAPRRRGLRGPGHGRGGPEPRAAAGLPHRRHDPRRRQQPDRLHDAAVEGPLVGLLDGRREDQPGPHLPRQRGRSRRPRTACSRSRSTTGRSSTRTSSST